MYICINFFDKLFLKISTIIILPKWFLYSVLYIYLSYNIFFSSRVHRLPSNGQSHKKADVLYFFHQLSSPLGCSVCMPVCIENNDAHIIMLNFGNIKKLWQKIEKSVFQFIDASTFFFKTDFGTRGVTKPNAIPTLMSVHSLLLLGFFGRCGHSFSRPSDRALVSQGFESHLFFIKWKETRQHFFCLTMGGWELNVDTQLVYILKKIQNIVWLHYFFIFPLPLW